jgi:hypothetical protein
MRSSDDNIKKKLIEFKKQIDSRFVYNSWQCIAEMNETNNTVMRSYVWGLDLSGTQTEAGGVHRVRYSICIVIDTRSFSNI